MLLSEFELTPPLLAIKFLNMTAASILEPSGLVSSAISFVREAKNFLYTILSPT
jgi:hypothetical protein